MDMQQNQQQNQNGYGNEQQAIPPGLAFAQAAKELMEAALSMQENPEVQSFIKASYGKLQSMCGKAYPDAGLQWKEEIGLGKEDKNLDEDMDLDEDLDEDSDDSKAKVGDMEEKAMDYEDGDSQDEGSSSDMVPDDSDDDSAMDQDDEDMADDEDADEEESEGDGDENEEDEDDESDEEDEDEENMDEETKKLVKRLSDSVKQTSRNIEAVNKSISSLSGRIS